MMYQRCVEDDNDLRGCYRQNSTEVLFPFYFVEPEHAESNQIQFFGVHHFAYFLTSAVLYVISKYVLKMTATVSGWVKRYLSKVREGNRRSIAVRKANLMRRDLVVA